MKYFPLFALLVAVCLASPLLAARIDSGYGRYTLIEGDVIFNEGAQQLRLDTINASNRSVNLHFISFDGSSTFLRVLEGKTGTIGESCVILHSVILDDAWAKVDLTWSPNLCIIPTGPRLEHVRVGEIGRSFASIVWDTNESGNSTVLYKSANKSYIEAFSSSFVNSHRITLNDLRPATGYEFQVKSCQDGNNSNCTLSQTGTFTTLSGEEMDLRGEKTTTYPLYLNSKLALQGFVIGFKKFQPGSVNLTVSYDGEDLCVQNPAACLFSQNTANSDFLKATGISAVWKEANSQLALIDFTTLASTRFPPGIILRPFSDEVEVNQTAQIEVTMYDTGDGHITQANFTYWDKDTPKTIAVVEGKNVVTAKFSQVGTQSIAATAVNKAGRMAIVNRTLLVKSPTPPPAPTPQVINKKKATPTPVASNLTPIEKIRQQLAKQEKEKPFNPWAYAVPALVLLLVIGLAVGGFLFFKGKKKSPAK